MLDLTLEFCVRLHLCLWNRPFHIQPSHFFSDLPTRSWDFYIHRTKQVATLFTFFSTCFFTQQCLGSEECSRVNTILYTGLKKRSPKQISCDSNPLKANIEQPLVFFTFKIFVSGNNVRTNLSRGSQSGQNPILRMFPALWVWAEDRSKRVPTSPVVLLEQESLWPEIQILYLGHTWGEDNVGLQVRGFLKIIWDKKIMGHQDKGTHCQI